MDTYRPNTGIDSTRVKVKVSKQRLYEQNDWWLTTTCDWGLQFAAWNIRFISICVPSDQIRSTKLMSSNIKYSTPFCLKGFEVDGYLFVFIGGLGWKWKRFQCCFCLLLVIIIWCTLIETNGHRHVVSLWTVFQLRHKVGEVNVLKSRAYRPVRPEEPSTSPWTPVRTNVPNEYKKS